MCQKIFSLERILAAIIGTAVAALTTYLVSSHLFQKQVTHERAFFRKQVALQSTTDVYLPLLASMVKPETKYQRNSPKEFSTWTEKFLIHQGQMYAGKIGETRKEKPYRNFEKMEIRGINYTSGLTAGKDRCFWAVSDRQNKLFHLDRLKHRMFVRETVELKFAEGKKEKIAAENPEFKFDRLDMEGIAYNHKRGFFYIASEENRAVLVVSEADKGQIIDYFFVEGQDQEKNMGLEGIAFDPERDIIFVIDEGPWDGPKRLYRYDTAGKKIGEPIEIKVSERITGITSLSNGKFVALNTSRSREGDLYRVIEFKENGEQPSEIINILEDYSSFKDDLIQFQTNYEGIDFDEEGSIYIINDATKGNITNILVISPTQ